jgi:serine/threonine-protein kinase
VNDEALAVHADPARAFDGQYQLGAEIGAGALGVVYRGVDEKLDKPVAIKVWHARLDDQAPLREQYDAEARALTALDHPNVVAITDYGIAGQAPYLIMELLEGQTLGARMRAGALTASLTQTFMQSVLRGLGYMHMRGVIHRNLNPNNVFLHKLDADSEQLKLLDLRLEALPATTNADAQNRRSAYDAPEQAEGIEPDGRSDVYAAGVMMLHMLTGREPTRELVRAAADSAELLENLLPTATAEVRAFIARAVAPERAARFGNADQMLRALLELATPWAGDPPGAVAAQKKVTSIRPKSEPAHAGFDLSATALGKGETIPLSAANGGEHAPDQDQSDEDISLGPIGLIAKLRARKRLFLIGGGVLGLLAISGVVAMVLSSRAATERAAQELEAAEHAQADKAKAAKKAKAAAAAAEDEDEEEEARPLIKRVEPGAEHPQAEPEKYAARLGDTQAEAKPTAEEAAGAAAPPAKPDVAAPGAKPGTEHAAEAAKPTGPPAQAAAPVAEPPPTAASATALPNKPAAKVAEHGASIPSEQAAPTVSAAQPAAVSGKADPSSTAAPAPVATKAAEPKAPTPEQIGSQRHIEPDKNEIRQMLALAISPKPRVAARNPWNIEVPGSLQALRDAITKGERGTSGNLKALRSYNATNPDDVYGHLLLGGFYANRGFSLDALDQYDMAYRIDSSSRGAPEMLKHALNMVVQGIAETDAARFVERVYGREALTAIAQRAQARDTNPAATRRLKQLQARIAGGKRR